MKRPGRCNRPAGGFIRFQYNPSDSHFQFLMRKAALFYNPLSGRRRERRLADVAAALAVLHQAGIEATSEPTRGQAEAGEQARQAIAEGCDTIFACGGDGTAHDVLQGMVGSHAALGVIPLGTANTLAHDLRLAAFRGRRGAGSFDRNRSANCVGPRGIHRFRGPSRLPVFHCGCWHRSGCASVLQVEFAGQRPSRHGGVLRESFSAMADPSAGEIRGRS